MKRSYQVKLTGLPPFSMIVMEDGEDPERICRAIWFDRVEWVK